MEQSSSYHDTRYSNTENQSQKIYEQRGTVQQIAKV